MKSTMMPVALSLNHLLDRAGHLFGSNEIVFRLPDKWLRRHSYAQFHRRTRALASALQRRAAAAVPPVRAPAPLREGDRVPVLGCGGAGRVRGLRSDAGRRRPRRIPVCRPRRERSRLHVLHVGHDGAAEGRGVFAPLHRAAHAGRQPGRFLGAARHRRRAARHADVPCQQLGHPVRRGDVGREAGLPRPAPAPGRPARSDPRGAADAVAGGADDLAWADPGL